MKNLSPKDIDVVILCGGKGERLRTVVADKPKSMADVEGRPFLDLVIDYVASFGFLRFILCAGYLGDQIEQYYGKKSDKRIIISNEEISLGTGGAIKNVSQLIESNPFIVMNGDSYCLLDFQNFVDDYFRKEARHEVVLNQPSDRKDVGLVKLGPKLEVTSFVEEGIPSGQDVASAGIYLFDKEILDIIPNKRCSLEHDILPALIGKRFYGYLTEAPCFDIGTPERYLQFLQNRARIGC